MEPRDQKVYRSVRLSWRHREAATLLTDRTLGFLPRRGTSIGAQILEKLWGEFPNFGQLAECSEKELREASHGHVVDRITAFTDLALALRQINPWTPVCPKCHECPITVSGGVSDALDEGGACPFCDGQVELVPMTLKKVT